MIGVVHPDAVRRHGAAVEDAERVQRLGGSRVALGQLVVVLLLGFGKMDHQRRVVLVGQRARRP